MKTYKAIEVSDNPKREGWYFIILRNEVKQLKLYSTELGRWKGVEPRDIKYWLEESEQEQGDAIELLKRISSESMCSVVADEWIHEFLNSQHLTEQPSNTRELSEEELLEKAEELSAKRQYSDQGFQIYITGFEDSYKLFT